MTGVVKQFVDMAANRFKRLLIFHQGFDGPGVIIGRLQAELRYGVR